MVDAEEKSSEAEEAGPVSQFRARVDAVGLIAVAGLGAAGVPLVNSLGRSHAVREFRRIEGAAESLDVLAPDTLVVGYEEGAGPALNLMVAGRQRGVPVVLALINSYDPKLVDQALRSGAHDVIPPPHSARELILRRRVQLRTGGGTSDDSDLPGRHVPLGPLVIDLTMRQVLDGNEPLTLTGREFELLVRLMQEQGEVVQRERLIGDIWGDGGSQAVLDATVHRLRRKLKRKVTDEELVITVRGVGYRIRSGSFRTPTSAAQPGDSKETG